MTKYFQRLRARFERGKGFGRLAQPGRTVMHQLAHHFGRLLAPTMDIGL